MKGTFSLFRHLLLFFHWLFLSLSLLLFLFKFYFLYLVFTSPNAKNLRQRKSATYCCSVNYRIFPSLCYYFFFLGFCVARNFPPLAVCNKCRLLIQLIGFVWFCFSNNLILHIVVYKYIFLLRPRLHRRRYRHNPQICLVHPTSGRFAGRSDQKKINCTLRGLHFNSTS